MKEIAENIRRNHVTPNPLTKAGPIVVTDQTANEKVGGISQVSEKTRIVGRETSLEKKLNINDRESISIYLKIVALLILLVCVLLGWRKISKK